MIDNMRLTRILGEVTYGERLKELRESRGLTQEKLAELVYGTKEQQGNIATCESMAGRVPRPETIRKHAMALRYQISEFLRGIDDTWLDRARRGEFDVLKKPAESPPSGRRTARV